MDAEVCAPLVDNRLDQGLLCLGQSRRRHCRCPSCPHGVSAYNNNAYVTVLIGRFRPDVRFVFVGHGGLGIICVIDHKIILSQPVTSLLLL